MILGVRNCGLDIIDWEVELRLQILKNFEYYCVYIIANH